MVARVKRGVRTTALLLGSLFVGCGGSVERNGGTERGGAPSAEDSAADTVAGTMVPTAGRGGSSPGGFSGDGPPAKAGAPTEDAGGGGSPPIGGAPGEPPAGAPAGEGGETDHIDGMAGAGGDDQGTGSCSRTSWLVAASSDCFPTEYADCTSFMSARPSSPAEAIDSNLSTGYTAGRNVSGTFYLNGTENITVWFPSEISIAGAVLIAPNAEEAAEHYAIQLLDENDNPVLDSLLPWSADETPSGQVTITLPFPRTSTRALRIQQTTAKIGLWTVLELDVIGCR